jgi:hypothetical protein
MLHRVAGALCSVEIRERVIDALIADCQHEWLSAANSTTRVSAVARCWVSFWIALGVCLAHDVRHNTFGFVRRVVAPAALAGFLLILGMSTYSLSVKRAKEAVLRDELRRIRIAIDQYKADTGRYPSDIRSLDTKGYLRDSRR